MSDGLARWSTIGPAGSTLSVHGVREAVVQVGTPGVTMNRRLYALHRWVSAIALGCLTVISGTILWAVRIVRRVRRLRSIES